MINLIQFNIYIYIFRELFLDFIEYININNYNEHV